MKKIEDDFEHYYNDLLEDNSTEKLVKILKLIRTRLLLDKTIEEAAKIVNIPTEIYRNYETGNTCASLQDYDCLIDILIHYDSRQALIIQLLNYLEKNYPEVTFKVQKDGEFIIFLMNNKIIMFSEAFLTDFYSKAEEIFGEDSYKIVPVYDYLNEIPKNY